MGPARRWRERGSLAPCFDIPISLVVDGSTEVVAITREVARSLRAVARVCQATDAALLAQRWQAFAVVMPWTSPEADGRLYEQLSRTSGAQVIALSTVLPSPEALRSAMRIALVVAGR